MVRVNKEPVSAYTHLAGFAASLVGVVVLLLMAGGDTMKTAGMLLYGAGLLTVFLSSGTYHLLDLGERHNRWLQRMDHSAIFLLIAGTYIYPMLYTLDGAWRITMVSVVGGIAVVGTLLKLVWIDCPRWLSASIYLAMGWIVVVPAYMVLPRLPTFGLAWLVIGGAAYTLGALIYVLERPDFVPGRFGHHELWHVFVLVGAASHYVFMIDLVQRPFPYMTA